MSDVLEKARSAVASVASDHPYDCIGGTNETRALSAALNRLEELEKAHAGGATISKASWNKLTDERDALKARVEELEEANLIRRNSQVDLVDERDEWRRKAEELSGVRDAEVSSLTDENLRLRAQLADANRLLQKVNQLVGTPVQDDKGSLWANIRAHLAKEGGEPSKAVQGDEATGLLTEAYDIIRTNLPAFSVWIESAGDFLGYSEPSKEGGE